MSLERNIIKDIKINGTIGNISLENSLKVEIDKNKP